ncbi:MAG: hypothetical protein GXP55_20615, partial [Deltaproteobacteria bacterium]|nr:hypothetical protein [Deltaproteobacteria bacterium]
ERVAAYLEGVHLAGEGRLFPVDVRHEPGRALLPERDGIESRLLAALEKAADDPGDVLVFLPGKAEIAGAADSLRGRADLSVLALHGGLSLDEQSRAFAPTKKRKVLLATNVAETSITVPGVGVVIDGGLVRQTRYQNGRGFLTLAPIAMDSAEQRSGRAGRTGPGVCYRLWSPSAVLADRTAPEIHRMSLVPLVLAASACGHTLDDLPFLDAPKAQATADAYRELVALDAIDGEGALTDAGRELFGLPLDAHLGRLLVEARRRGTLDDMIDLVAALAVGRPLFVARPEYDEDDLRAAGCDAVALVRALRIGKPSTHGLGRFSLAEARRYETRLRRALKQEASPDDDRPVDREALARTVLAADPRAAHIARRRRGRVAWANGGTELTLARESAANKKLDKTEALLVLESRAFGVGARDSRVLATAAMPVPLQWLVDAGLGRERVASVQLAKRRRVVAVVERVYAKRVLSSEERVPEGALAREAMRDLFVRGSLFKDGLRRCKENLETRALAVSLSSSAVARGWDLSEISEAPPPLEEWVLTRLEELGVEHGSDLRMLSADDLVADPLPEHLRALLDKEYPRKLEVGGATLRPRQAPSPAARRARKPHGSATTIVAPALHRIQDLRRSRTPHPRAAVGRHSSLLAGLLTRLLLVSALSALTLLGFARRRLAQLVLLALALALHRRRAPRARWRLSRQLEAGHLLPRHTGGAVFFDQPEVGGVVVVDEGDGHAGLARSPCAPDAMHVVSGRAGEIVIQHREELGDVDAPRS